MIKNKINFPCLTIQLGSLGGGDLDDADQLVYDHDSKGCLGEDTLSGGLYAYRGLRGIRIGGGDAGRLN